MIFQGTLEAIISFVQTHQGWAGPIVFVLAFGESLALVSLVLPFWSALVGIGSLFVATGSFSDMMMVWVAASLGAALGDWVSYALGYYFKDDIGKVWPLRSYPDLLPRGHDFFERYGIWAVFIGRFFGPFRAAVPVVAGIVRMPWVTFQIANFASAFAWAGIILAPGSLALKWWFGAY